VAISEPLPKRKQSRREERPPRNGRWSGFTHLLAARMKELWREPEVLFWIFVFPILLALGLGIAFRDKPPDTTPVVIVAGNGAESTLAMLRRSSQSSLIHAQIAGREAALLGFRLGKYDLVIEPQGAENVQYLYDPARPESVLSRREVDDALQSTAGRTDPLTTTEKVSSEPGSRYIDFLIPGLIGMNIMNAAMWGLGFALVDMRQRKLLKRFVGTPMRRSDFLMALASSRLLLMLTDVGLLMGFGVFIFHLRVLGSWITILLIGAAGALAFSGVGLLSASRAQKIESASGIINLIMMPMWIFSGVFFSYERFPAVVQPFIRALPLTALNDALRSTVLEGAPLASQTGRLLILLLWGGLSFLLALRLFRWT
jgi:ABC-2 type transport system permease protein